MTPAPPPSISPSLKRRGYLALAFNACFFVFIAWWLYNNVSYAELSAQLQRIPTSAILLAMTMNLAVLALYGLRVATILRAKPLPCFLITNIGFTFNALIPFRIGEGVKIYFGATYFKLPIGALGAAIVMEKIYDLSAIITIAALIAATSDSTIVDLGGPTILALMLVLALFAGLIVYLRWTGAPLRLPQWKLLETLRLDAILEQAESLLASHNVSRAVFITATIWTVNVCLVFFLFSALLPGTGFSVLSAMSVLVISSLAIAVPASPAGLGIFEAGLVSYLATAYGVQTEQAISTALAYHFCITAPHTVIAVVFLGSVFVRSLKA